VDSVAVIVPDLVQQMHTCLTVLYMNYYNDRRKVCACG